MSNFEWPLLTACSSLITWCQSGPERDRQTVTTDALGFRTTLTLDAVGNVTQVTDPLNHNTQFLHDALNRQTVTIDAEYVSRSLTELVRNQDIRRFVL